jgi:hypothetical protein
MKTHYSLVIPCGFLLIAIGLVIRYQIGRRRFNRRGIGGLQHFDGYGRGLITTIIENFINLMGTLILRAGIFLLVIAGINHFKF